MNAQNINQILDAMAARFGTTGSYLWALIVRQQYIDAVLYSILGVVLVSAVPICWHFARKEVVRQNLYNKSQGWREDATLGAMLNGAVPLPWICAIVGVVGLVVLVAQISRAMNPEYYALMDVIYMLRGSSK